MKIEVGFVAHRRNGEWVETRKLYRDIPASETKNGITRCEERCLKTAAVNVFAELAKTNPDFKI